MIYVLNYSGVLFICFNVDQRVLWSGATEDVAKDVVKDGFQFYTTFFNAPPAIKVPRLDLTLLLVPYMTLGSPSWHVCSRSSWTYL